jgi:hypothetical protein
MSGYSGGSTRFRDGQIDCRQLLRFFPIQKGMVLFESSHGSNVGYGVGDKLAAGAVQSQRRAFLAIRRSKSRQRACGNAGSDRTQMVATMQ